MASIRVPFAEFWSYNSAHVSSPATMLVSLLIPLPAWISAVNALPVVVSHSYQSPGMVTDLPLYIPVTENALLSAPFTSNTVLTIPSAVTGSSMLIAVPVTLF